MMYIENKQYQIYRKEPPDIETIVKYHPLNWRHVQSAVTTPAWQRSAKGDYDKVAARTYQDDNGERITIVITWSRNGIQRAGHIQQLCYTTQGFKIENVQNVTIDVEGKKQNITYFTAKRITGDNEEVVYWRITDGKILENSSYIEYNNFRLLHRVLKMKEIINSLYGDIPENIMVRISTVGQKNIINKDRLEKYTEEYLKSIPEYERKIVMIE